MDYVRNVNNVGGDSSMRQSSGGRSDRPPALAPYNSTEKRHPFLLVLVVGGVCLGNAH